MQRMYGFDKESQSNFGDPKQIPKNHGDSMKFMHEIVWNRQFLMAFDRESPTYLSDSIQSNCYLRKYMGIIAYLIQSTKN